MYVRMYMIFIKMRQTHITSNTQGKWKYNNEQYRGGKENWKL